MPDALLLPRVWGGQTVVALADVAGIGMRYVSPRSVATWRLFVWTEDGSRRAVRVPGPDHAAPAGQRSRLRGRASRTPVLDWDYLAHSPAGAAALTIARNVQRTQGDGGLWARSSLEFRAPSGVEIAAWSPDGRVQALR